MNYNCIVSIGIRCFTEIYLKQMDYKKFSSPFDGLYLSSVKDIIYLLENKINKNDLIYTENDKDYENYNEKWGFRTIHTMMDNTLVDKNNYIESSYHNATFSHHNLKDNKIWKHFERCFDRFEIIKKKNIKTIFCLFIHPQYPGYVNISDNDIKKLSEYLYNKFNCHLLVIEFNKIFKNGEGRGAEGGSDITYNIKDKTEKYTYYIVNNNQHTFIYKDTLQQIFENDFNIDKSKLLTYNYFNTILNEN